MNDPQIGDKVRYLLFTEQRTGEVVDLDGTVAVRDDADDQVRWMDQSYLEANA